MTVLLAEHSVRGGEYRSNEEERAKHLTAERIHFLRKTEREAHPEDKKRTLLQKPSEEKL